MTAKPPETVNAFATRTPGEERLFRSFQQAATELLQIIKGMEPSASRLVMQSRLRKIVLALAELDAKAKLWVDTEIPKTYRQGETDAVAYMTSYGETEFKIFPNVGVSREAMRVLVEETYLAFADTLKGVGRSAQKALRDIQKSAIQDRIVADAAKGSGAEETKKEVVQNLEDQGFTALKANNGAGRRFEFLDYADILVRSQTMNAYNTATTNRMLAAGRRYGFVPFVRPDIDGYDICNEWEGHVIDLLDPGQVKPPFHPRCRHVIVPAPFGYIRGSANQYYASALEFFQGVAAQQIS